MLRSSEITPGSVLQKLGLRGSDLCEGGVHHGEYIVGLAGYVTSTEYEWLLDYLYNK